MFFGKWSLRAKTAMLLVLASIMPLLFEGIADIHVTRQELEKQTEYALTSRTEALASRIDTFNASYLTAAQVLAADPVSIAYLSNGEVLRQDLVRSRLEAQVAVDGNLCAVGLLDARGRIGVSAGGKPLSADLSRRRHIMAALAGSTAVSDLMSGELQGAEIPMIAYVAPVIAPSGMRLGVAVMWVKAEVLWRLAKTSSDIGDTATFSVLLDRYGIRIAHTAYNDLVFHPSAHLSPELLEQFVADQRFGERTRRLLEDVQPFPEQYARAISPGDVPGMFRGLGPVNRQMNLGASERLKTADWTVFFMMPEAILDQQVSSMIWHHLLFTGAVLLMALAIGAAIASTILRPVRSLAVATRRIAAGDLTARSAFAGSDELGLLGSSFDVMATQIEFQAGELERNRQELERRVEERTADVQNEISERRRAQDEALASQHLLRGIVDSSNDAIISKDMAGIITSWNKGAETILGFSSAEALNQPMQICIPPELHAEEAMILERIAKGERIENYETQRLRKDGRRRQVAITVSPILEHGRIVGASKILRDITDQKAMEAVRVRLASIVESSDDAIISKQLDGTITSWNRAAETLFGFTAQEALGRPMAICIPEDRVDEEREILAKISADQHIEHYETVRQRKDGSRIEVSITISPIKDGHGTIIGASKIARDISERKHNEARLRAQLQRLDLLSSIARAIGERQDLPSIFQVVIHRLEEHLPLDFGMICLNEPPAGALIVSRLGAKSFALAEQLGLSEGAVVPIDQNGLSRCMSGVLVYEADISDSAYPFPSLLASGGLRSFVAAPLMAAGEVFGALIVARRRAAGFSSGECEFMKQLSEQVALAAHQAKLYLTVKQAYDELNQTQQAVMQQERLRVLGQMASGVAHDINNAISPVLLYADMLLNREPGLSVNGRKYLEIIRRSTEDVGATIARLGEFYRHGEAKVLLAPVDLNELVQYVLALTRARWNDMAQERGIVVETESRLDSGLPVILGMATEIREALINLVFNALDAMPQGGRLTIATWLQEPASSGGEPGVGKRVCVEVVDTGIGMDADTSRRCLEPFFTTKGERGSGLGLAMVFGVMRRHQGEIGIVSRVGEGSSFRLSFPVSANIRPAEQSRIELRIEPLSILLVDDDQVLLESLRLLLAADGHAVVAEPDSRKAVATFRARLGTAGAFAVVISDLGMPHCDGRQVAVAIKDAAAETPVILLTGWGERMVGEGDIPPGVDLVLSKPPKIREIRAALRACAPETESGKS